MLKKLLAFWKKIRRAKRLARSRSAIPPYLLKDFEAELNYKLWTTKGARFTAGHRTETQHRLSGQCVGYLSAYLIIVGLVNVYGLNFWNDQIDQFRSELRLCIAVGDDTTIQSVRKFRKLRLEI